MKAYDVDGILVSSEEISGCEGPIPGNGITTINFDNINYTCGTTLEITNLLIAWTSASPNEVCPLDRNDIKPKCGTAKSIEVVPPLFTVVNSQTDETCESSNDGSIDITTEGGSGSYTYNWTDLSGTKNMEDRQNLAPGTYSVIVTDSDGCSTALNGIIVAPGQNPDAPVVSATVQPTCETATGSITVTTVNGLQYSIGGDYQSSGSFTGLAAGTYNVTAKNADGCISPATSASINQQPNTPNAPVVSTTVQPTCETATGSFTLTTVNGLQYSIGGDYQTSGSFTGLAAGTYNVTAKNADGCISPATSVVIQEQPNTPDAPVVSTAVQPTCETATGSFTLTTVNGLQYSIGGDYQTSGSFTGLAAGTYNVTAKNTDGCISPATSVVIQEQPNTPDAPVVSTAVQPTCDTATGSFTVTTVNGLQYSIGGDYQTSGSFTGLSAGTYNITAKNADGCISPATSVVIQEQPNTPDAPVVSATVQPTCDTATGSITITTAQGFTYSINGTDYQSSGSFTGLAAGTYNVTAKNADGCISPATSVVIQEQPNTPDAPVVSTTVQPTCDTATGSFTVMTAPGFTYSINGTDYQSSGSFTGLAAGTYNVTAKNADGCISPATSVVIQEQPNTPDAPVVSTTVQPTCETETGSFTVTAVNGLQYSIGGDYQSSGSFTGLSAGTYNVTAKNADGCISPATSVVIQEQPNTPNAPVVSATIQPTCETATGSITLTTVIGLQYSIGGDYQSSGSFTGLAAGTYNVTAKNADGCISPATSVVIQEQPNTPDAPVVSATVQPTCETATGSFTLTTVNGLQYSIGGDYQSSGSFTGLAAGTYNVTAKNADGCISPATSVVIQEQPNTPDAPVVSATVQPTCETATGSFNVTTTQGFTYSINGTDYQSSGSFTGLSAGTYNVTAKNTDGCISPATSVVIQEQPFGATANDDLASADEDNAVDINVLSNDFNPEDGELGIVSFTQPSNGTVNQNQDNTLSYSPIENFNGTDTFEYTVTNGNCGTDTATVTVTVGAENDAPIAVDDSASTIEDTPVDITVLDNDSDPDGDELTVTISEAQEPANGTVTIDENGVVTYTPDENFNGTDSFDYTISDGNGGTDTATVTVTVGAENDAPIAVDDSASTIEDTPVDITVLDNDSDPDGDELTVTISEAQEPANGTVTIDENGVVTYTPDENFNGTDSFDYTISDGNGGTDTATVTVTVGAENDAPIAVDDSASTIEDTPVEI
ncbi:Ig-like domain-containing protein, partial [Christiangramia marina]|uniref:Ig-like domain-containing protein n=1 Tax=Christiangramia marina TaxID=409436 RepID=UPI003AA973FB